MKLIINICCLLATWCTVSDGADILYISLSPCPSHHIWDKTLAMALRERHHKITFLTHSVEKSVENFTVIYFEGIYEDLTETFTYDDMATVSNIEAINIVFEWVEYVCEWDFKTKGFQELIRLVDSKPHFDLIIFDTLTGQCLYPIMEKLNFPPLVGVSQFGIMPYHNHLSGIDMQMAYVPLYLLPFTNQMTYFQRVYNWFYTQYFILCYKYVFFPSVTKRTQEHFGTDISPLEDINKHISLLLANFDHVLDYPMSLPPSVIPVGGLHTKRDKELPKDLQKILDESKDGIVYFCLGTNWRSADLKLDQRQELIEGLGRLKQTVLWKFEEKIEGLPKNIIVRPWMPQNDILAHPNVKVFLTHGGGLSTQEAMFHGIPVVSMPFFADQIRNTQRMVNRKLGQKLIYGQLTADDVYNTLTEVLNNPIYKQESLKISRRYRNQPQDALTRAIWWIEYTIQEGGAQHLAMPSLHMSAYQIALLDVWALVLAIIGLPILILVRYCFCRQRCGNSKKKTE